MTEKNNDKCIVKELNVEPGFTVLKFNNDRNTVCEFSKETASDIIQIHFSLKNKTFLLFGGGSYVIPVIENSSMLLYNPQKELPVQLRIDPGSKYILLLVTIEKFHSFFTEESALIRFLDGAHKDKKFYQDKKLGAHEIVVLNELFKFELHSSLEILYTKGKIFELISLYFHRSDDSGQHKCPFLEDVENVDKIKMAKEILIKNMSDPPGLKELSDRVKISIQHLKDGFKHVYGTTVYAYLLDYKMEYARKLLLSRKYNVAETGFELGYSTPSHFITAFKKKFGTTPRKYLKSL